MDRLMRSGMAYESWTAESGQRENWQRSRDAGSIELGGRYPGASRDEESQERLAWLVSTIEAEIIPRLMLAHRTPSRVLPRSGTAPRMPGPADIDALARNVVAADTAAAKAQVASMRAAGLALDVLYLQVLAPTARHLGDLWEADVVDFTEVTAGLWRLQQVMYDLSPAFQSDGDVTTRARRALLAPAPGSQHTFGLLMVAEFFQRAGWDVWTEPSVSLPTLLEAAGSAWFDVVGFSVGTACQLQAVASAIQGTRGASLNPQLGVMVGGPAFHDHPEWVAQVGADATASDALEAVMQAEILVDELCRARRRAHS